MEADDAAAAALLFVVVVRHAFVAIPMEADHAPAASLLFVVVVRHAFVAIPMEADDAPAASLLFVVVVRHASIAVPMHALRASLPLVSSAKHAFTALPVETGRTVNRYVQIPVGQPLQRGSLIHLAGCTFRPLREAEGFVAGAVGERRGIGLRRLDEQHGGRDQHARQCCEKRGPHGCKSPNRHFTWFI
jgi:hypothetical protein